MEAVVLSVGNNHMVHKMDMHQLAGPLDTTCKFIVGPAGSEASRGVVVTHCHDGGITEYGLADDDADPS